jgi:GNAT superfamily N-acetyltransferase
MEQHSLVEFSAIDSERFSIRVARANGVTADNISEVLRFCTAKSIDLLIARCDSSNFAAVHLMEHSGFALMDTLLYYKFELAQAITAELSSEARIRPFTPDDKPAVSDIAASAFRDYRGHYHADPRLDKEKCNEAYISWAERACVTGKSNDVLVAETGSGIVGFAVVRLNNADEGDGVLFAVRPSMQGRGIFQVLLAGAISWCRARGARHMLYSTQLTNIAAQRVLSRSGFYLDHAYYTFHKWFVADR